MTLRLLLLTIGLAVLGLTASCAHPSTRSGEGGGAYGNEDGPPAMRERGGGRNY